MTEKGRLLFSDLSDFEIQELFVYAQQRNLRCTLLRHIENDKEQIRTERVHESVKHYEPRRQRNYKRLHSGMRPNKDGYCLRAIILDNLLERGPLSVEEFDKITPEGWRERQAFMNPYNTNLAAGFIEHAPEGLRITKRGQRALDDFKSKHVLKRPK
jgi:hypothetical protein